VRGCARRLKTERKHIMHFRTIYKSGNAYVIAIPKEIVEYMHIRPKTQVSLSVTGQSSFAIDIKYIPGEGIIKKGKEQ